MDPDKFSLRIEPDPILYQKLEDFDFNQSYDCQKIEDKMIDIMKKSGGIGISANQVGFNRRVVIVALKEHAAFAMFNPRLVSSKNPVIEEEGCLSFPDLYIKIERDAEITVEYFDKTANPCIITLVGYDARCLQHEMDHLDGICFTNRVSKLKLDLARKRQRKIKNGRTK